MADMQSGIEGQLKSLTEKVAFLQETVDELSVRLQTLEKGEPFREKPQRIQDTRDPQQVTNMQPQPGVLKKAGTGALLPRVAAVCFALVVALILRTITDNGIINTQLGSMLGLGYAVTLIIGGWWLYSHHPPIMSVTA